MFACEKEIIYPQDCFYGIIPIQTILSKLFGSSGEDGYEKKNDVSKRKGVTVSRGKFSLYFFDNESIYLTLHIQILISKPTFAALYISINVLCYALSFHLSDTLLCDLTELDFYGCKVRKSKS